MIESMDPDEANNNFNGDGSVSNPLTNKILELERSLREEKERYDLLQFESCQEFEKHARDCLSLSENVKRLQEDRVILREREVTDQQKMKGLMQEIERKDRVFKDKFVDLKNEIRDHENEALEWKKKYFELKERSNNAVELESRALQIVNNGKGNAGKVDEEMPKRRAEEDLVVLTPEPTRGRILKGVNYTENETDEDDDVPIAQRVSKKPSALGNQPASYNGIVDKMKPPKKKFFPRQVLIKEKDTFDGREDGRIQVSPAKKKQKVCIGYMCIW